MQTPTLGLLYQAANSQQINLTLPIIAIPMTDPWDSYIYLHEWLIFMGSIST